MASRSFPGIPVVPLVTTVLATVLFFLVGGLFLVVDRILEGQIRASMVDETGVWAQSLAESTAKALWNFDDKSVQLLGEAAAQNPLVLGLEIQNDQGHVIYHTVKAGSPLTKVWVSVRYEGMIAGFVALTSAAELVRTRVNALEMPASLAGGVFLLLVVVVTPLVLSRTILKPIRSLGRLVETVDPVTLSEDSWETGSPIREVRALERALSTLTRAVRQNLRHLEVRVEERTAALRMAQSQLAHAEVLATLGQLTAGIAHELNTPLAAILSATRTLQSEVQSALWRLLAANWTLETVSEPLKFLEDVAARAKVLDPRREFSARQELRNLWREKNRDVESDLFDLVATNALLPVGKEVAAWPSPIAEETSLKVVILMARLLGVIDVAAEKGAAVVQALRGQLKHDQHESPTWFPVAASLEECLLLHRTHLQPGIEVRRTYDPGFQVYGPRARLGQVWLNLINNALQAVENPGWIEVEATLDQGWAQVRVSDSGPPVPTELRDRLFEPYFTTKPTGLGLGLNLSLNIVEALGGHLTYQDCPGPKSFIVRWPQPLKEPEVLGSKAGSDSPGPPTPHPSTGSGS